MSPFSESGSPPFSRAATPEQFSTLQTQIARTPLVPSSPPQNLPSSPSPGRVTDSMPLNAPWMESGYWGDDTLPPFQAEGPFRFLDLPAEVRNMVYLLVLTKDPLHKYLPRAFSEDDCPVWFSRETETRIMQEWLPPPISFVNKQLRQETMAMFYATNVFNIWWDPDRPYIDWGGDTKTEGILKKFERGVAFLANNNLWTQGVIFRELGYRYWGANSLRPLVDFVRVMAPLSRAQIEPGVSHSNIGGIYFDYGLSTARRIFEFAGTLSHDTLRDRRLIDQKLRLFMRSDHKASPLLRNIQDHERRLWDDFTSVGRRYRKEERFRKNTIEGEERWTGVLRSRPARQDELQ